MWVIKNVLELSFVFQSTRPAKFVIIEQGERFRSVIDLECTTPQKWNCKMNIMLVIWMGHNNRCCF